MGDAEQPKVKIYLFSKPLFFGGGERREEDARGGERMQEEERGYKRTGRGRERNDYRASSRRLR